MKAVLCQNRRFNYRILQEGSIVLKPDGRRVRSLEHRCSSVLLWPVGEKPASDNTLMTDPCFTAQGFENAEKRLSELGLSFNDISRIFITHPHADHRLHVPFRVRARKFPHFHPDRENAMSGISLVPCPGHSNRLRSLIFREPSGDSVWITGDAVLDEEWLTAWEYYWPNVYSRDEIIQTWKSVTTIIAHADVIIPGHGPPFRVTISLVSYLAGNFENATYADQCAGEVKEALAGRLDALRR